MILNEFEGLRGGRPEFAARKSKTIIAIWVLFVKKLLVGGLFAVG